MRQTMRLAVIAATVAMAATACTSAPEPAASPTPTAFVAPVIEGPTISSSGLEADEWVIAARAADLGYILAVNHQDFSIAQFTSTRPAWVAERQHRRWVQTNTGSGEPPFVYPGPSVLLPISVTETADGVEIEFCDASGLWLDGDGADEAAALADGRLATFAMVRDDSGAILLEDRQGSTTVCDATGAPIGRFDPQPVAPHGLEADEVPGPVG